MITDATWSWIIRSRSRKTGYQHNKPRIDYRSIFFCLETAFLRNCFCFFSPLLVGLRMLSDEMIVPWQSWSILEVDLVCWSSCNEVVHKFVLSSCMHIFSAIWLYVFMINNMSCCISYSIFDFGHSSTLELPKHSPNLTK